MLNKSVGDDILVGLRTTYKAVAVRHIHPWWTWGVLSVTLGFAIGILYVADQNAKFSAGHAQVISEPAGLTVSLSKPLPKGTIINAVKFDPTSNKPTQNWVFDDNYASILVSNESLSFTLNYVPSVYNREADNFFASNAPMGVEVELPDGLVYVSAPASSNAIQLYLNTPVGNLKKNYSTYKISASFVNKNGIKKAVKFSSVDDLNISYGWPSDYNMKLDKGAITMKVKGPLPFTGDLSINLGSDPTDPGFDIIYSDFIFIPNNGSGSYEFVFNDSSALEENAPIMCPTYAPPDGCWDIKEVIFTPEKGGKPFSTSTVRPPKPSPIQLGPNDVLLRSSKPLPVGTKILSVWASKKRPTKLWFVDGSYEDPTLEVSTEQIVDKVLRPDWIYTPKEASAVLGEPAQQAVIAILPNNDVLMSGRVVKQIAKLSVEKVIANPQKTTSTYKIKATFIDSQGNRIPISDAYFDVISSDHLPVRANLVADSLTITNPGPFPVYFYAEGTNPDTFGVISGEAYLPAYGSGVVEVRMHDSSVAFDKKHAHDTPEQYALAWDAFTINDIQKVIFTPNKTGTPQESNPADLGPAEPGQGSVVTLSTAPVDANEAKTKYGTKVADLVITNNADVLFPGQKLGPVFVRQLGFRLLVDGTTKFTPDTRIIIGTGPKAVISKKPIKCEWPILNNYGCFVTLFLNKKIAPGVTEHVGIIADTNSLPAGTIISPRIGDQVDTRYRYVMPKQKRGGKAKNIDYILTPAQVPIIFQDIQR